MGRPQLVKSIQSVAHPTLSFEHLLYTWHWTLETVLRECIRESLFLKELAVQGERQRLPIQVVRAIIAVWVQLREALRVEAGDNAQGLPGRSGGRCGVRK